MPSQHPVFRKSSYSNMDCVEAKPLHDGSVQIRNSRFPDIIAPTFTATEWSAFISGVKDGEFDFAPYPGHQARRSVPEAE